MLSCEQNLRYKFAVYMRKNCPFGRDALITRLKGPATVVVYDLTDKDGEAPWVMLI